ncbi:hypothetical protein C4B38_000370 [Diabrotica virgifera virgifera]|nr:hypothetical protein C4B38_000370 [Diabrotica virgifera virgifera]
MLFLGNAAFLLVEVLKTQSTNLKRIGETLDNVFLVFPHYSLATGINKCYAIYSYNTLCETVFDSCAQNNFTKDECISKFPSTVADICTNLNDNYFSWDNNGIAKNVTYSLISGVLWAILLFIIEYKFIARLMYYINQKFFPKQPILIQDEDDDVSKEKERIHMATDHDIRQTNILVVKDLTKYYNNFLAVNGLSIGIEKSECFGLLGINGAGKTTTFKMMSGDETVSYGDAWVVSLGRRTNPDSSHLYMSQQICILTYVVNERSCACMDPATKRYLWDSLCKIRDNGKCIVLTSHSMEECEALCTRIAIMVNGNFKCLGSTQHLKNKFAEGYTLTIKLKKLPESGGLVHADTESLEKYIKDKFPYAHLREKHQELLYYYITDTSMAWSTMFGILERAKRSDLNIEDYSLGQSSLEQKVKEMSGGNKRKLSTVLSLIGDPPVLFLDEPTTGMDPATKRYLWDSLCKIRDNGKCIVLTSHSMEECEALCTRIAIMVNGNFKCLGSTQHLKNKFAEGYTLTIKLKKLPESGGLVHADTEPLEKYIKDKFPYAHLREKHQELLYYYITDTSMAWSTMFGILERAKRSDLNIEDYSLGQSSLEQVFLTFTKHQNPEGDDVKKKN